MRILYIVDIDSKITEFSNIDAALEFLNTSTLAPGQVGYVVDCFTGKIRFRRDGDE